MGVIRQALLERFPGLFGQTDSNAVTVSIQAATRVLTLSADKTSVMVGEAVKFTGGFTVGGYAAAGTIRLFKNDVDTGLSTPTGQYGSYTINWTPTIEDEGKTLSFHSEATT